ncbi:MAG: flagellar filament capping protein FliD, partial [Bacillota bacterium]|nr:flagellar filament capping protein FliD [Bacillota bacterium]
NFFKASSITSSSSLVSAEGSISNISDIVLRNITSLATQTSLASTKKVSNESIVSGKIYDSWVRSGIGGASVNVTYGGKDYTLTLDPDFMPDSNDASKNAVDAVIGELNKQIANTDGLSGKVSFENIDSASGTIRLVTANAGDSVTLSATQYDSSKNLLTALGFKPEQLGVSTAGSIAAAATNESLLYNNVIESGSNLKFSIDGTAYTLDVGSNIDLSSCATNAASATETAKSLQKMVDDDPTLKGKLTVTADESGNISFAAVSGTLSVTGGSENLTQGLGLKNVDGTYSSSGAVDRTKLLSSYLGDELSGTSLTFTLDGVSKKITFNESEKASFDTEGELAAYLQSSLNSQFGSGKISVANTNGSLSFSVSDSTSILELNSSDNVNVLSKTGALRIGAGESNRLETSKTLDQLKSEIPGLTPGADGKYSLTVNGQSFTFNGNTKLSSVISTINNSDADVTVSYSSTTDTFGVKSKTAGTQGQIQISDAGGNLAASLFGTSGTDYTVKGGTNAVFDVSFDGGNTFQTITRSTNTVTLNDVNFTLNGLSANATDKITFTGQTKTDDLSDKLVDFVNDYNKIIDAVNTLVDEKYDKDYQPLTDTQKEDMSEDQIKDWETKAKTGLLRNDSTLTSLLSGLREAMTSVVDSTGTALYQAGISTQPYDYVSGGQLVTDTTKLKTELSSNLDDITKMFTGSDGIASRVKATLDSYISTSSTHEGALVTLAGTPNSTTPDDSDITKKIGRYDDSISKLKDQLKDEEERYWNKFTSMETALSALQNQSSYLTSMLSGS